MEQHFEPPTFSVFPPFMNTFSIIHQEVKPTCHQENVLFSYRFCLLYDFNHTWMSTAREDDRSLRNIIVNYSQPDVIDLCILGILH